MSQIQKILEWDSFTNVQTIVEAIMKIYKQSGKFNVSSDGYASMYELAHYTQKNKELISVVDIETLRSKGGIYLVNSTMSNKKLREFYTPPNIKEDFERCCKAIDKDLNAS